MPLRVAIVTAHSLAFPECAFLIGDGTDDLEARIRQRYGVQEWHGNYFETADETYGVTICDLHQ